MKKNIRSFVSIVAAICLFFPDCVSATVDDNIHAPHYPVSCRNGKGDYLKIKNLFGSYIDTEKLWTQVYEMTKYSPGQPLKKGKSEPSREKAEIDEYLYFPPIKLDKEESNEKKPIQKPRSFYLERGKSERLDIQNWNIGEDNQYVQIQLQIGTGQSDENSLASINVRKGIFYAPQHIMHCLVESYKTKAHCKKPQTINTDDVRFDRSKMQNPGTNKNKRKNQDGGARKKNK